MNNTDLLKEALKEYIDKWNTERDKLDKLEKTEYNVKYRVKLTSLVYLAQWIINSINGGLSRQHGTNICNIILRDDNYEY